MDKNSMEKLYAESKPCIEGTIVKILSKNLFLDRDELQSEANLVFCECADKYDPRIGSFIQLLSTTLYFRLFAKCRELAGNKRTLKGWKRSEELLEDIIFPNEEPEERFAESPDARLNDLVSATIANMSGDAQEMTAVIFNPPPELHRKTEENCEKLVKKHRRITQGVLMEYFRGIGWQRKRILRAFHEIKSGLHEVWA